MCSPSFIEFGRPRFPRSDTLSQSGPLKKHQIPWRSLKESFRGNSVKISDCRAFSPFKTLPGCRAFRHKVYYRDNSQGINVFRKSNAKVTILLYDFFIQGVIVPPTITHVTKLWKGRFSILTGFVLGLTKSLSSKHRRTGTFGLGGGGAVAVTLLPEKNYTMPERMCCANALKSQ